MIPFFLISCNDSPCSDCGKDAFCDWADGKCWCYAGYSMDSLGKCILLSRNTFLGEWTAKDTLCSGPCRTIPYIVKFYKHPTDEKLCYVSNLATQSCNNVDSAIWLVRSSNFNIDKLEKTTMNCIESHFNSSTYYSNTNHHQQFSFYCIINNDTLSWTIILTR